MRRSFFLGLLFLLLTTANFAQTPAALEGSPDIQIVKYNWTKERINWEKDPSAPRSRISLMCAVASPERGAEGLP